MLVLALADKLSRTEHLVRALSSMSIITYSTLAPSHKVNAIISLISQMKKLRHTGTD